MLATGSFRDRTGPLKSPSWFLSYQFSDKRKKQWRKNDSENGAWGALHFMTPGGGEEVKLLLSPLPQSGPLENVTENWDVFLKKSKRFYVRYCFQWARNNYNHKTVATVATFSRSNTHFFPTLRFFTLSRFLQGYPKGPPSQNLVIMAAKLSQRECNWHSLYRERPWKPSTSHQSNAVTVSQWLLWALLPNVGPTPCFRKVGSVGFVVGSWLPPWNSHHWRTGKLPASLKCRHHTRDISKYSGSFG